MNSSHSASLSAAARAFDLVREHHGLPEMGRARGEWERSEKLGRIARQNHLKARRRMVKLDEIPEAQFPVLLETNGGRNVVILKERVSEGIYGVQFSDSREAHVSGERLAETYTGNCIFLKPKSSSKEGGGSGRSFRLGRKLSELANSVRHSKGALGFNLLVLAFTWLLIHSNQQALGGLTHRSLVLPVLASGVAALALVGVIGLRHELFRHRVAASWMDLSFVPVMFGAAFFFAGWAVVPMLIFAAVLVGGILGSRRLGSVPSRLQRHWRMVVGTAFVIGVLSFSYAYMEGMLDATLMNGALGLSTYAVYLIANGGSSWQSLRLAMSS